MWIVAGTDFSDPGEQAARAAAAVATKLEASLLLAHVIDRESAEVRLQSELRLDAQLERLRRHVPAQLEGVVASGDAAEQLLALAGERRAEWLVLGARGERHALALGSVADAVVSAARCAVLVVREAESLRHWAEGARTLHALLGTGLGDSSRAALDWARKLPDTALTLAYVAWPAGEHYRLGIAGPIQLDGFGPELGSLLSRDLREWAGPAPGDRTEASIVSPGWGRIDVHLAELVRREQAELLIVGNHGRHRLARLWLGSVSRALIQGAPGNVACIPARARPDAASVKSVLIATDLSPSGNRAVAVGYGLLATGGVAHLVHVAAPGADAARARAELMRLEPESAALRGIVTEVHVVRGELAWRAVWQEANRLAADVICLSARARPGKLEVLLGSQTRELLAHSRVPIVVVPPDREP